MMAMPAFDPVLKIGRYELFGELAHGGMATVHLGRLSGPVGFARTVAIKRLHKPFVKDNEFRDMFVDEARLAARIRHPNVVSIIDVVQSDGELFLIMDFVQGVSLQRLMNQARKSGLDIPVNCAAAVIVGALHGLHAAHEVKGDKGERLDIVHRDVSPQNIMVAIDGVSRVLDFGIAKARGRLQNTTEGQVKGKFAYMPPEQVAGEDVGIQADVYAAGVVLWEMLAGRRLFKGTTDTQLITNVIYGAKESPRQYRPDVSEKLADVVMRAISVQPSQRYPTARDFAVALEEAVPIASAMQTGRWVEELAADALDQTALLVAEMESKPSLSGRERQSERPAGTVTSSEPPQGGSKSKIVTVVTPAPQTLWTRMLPIAFLLIGAAALLWYFNQRRDVPTQASANPQPSSEEAPARSTASAAAAPQPSATATETASSAAAAEPTDVAEEAPSTSASAAVAGRPVRRGVARAPAAAKSDAPPAATVAPRAPAACDPPYTIDSRGIQRIKPQCL